MKPSLDRRDVLKLLAALSVGAGSPAFSLVKGAGQETSLQALDFGEVEVAALSDLAKAYEDQGDEDDSAGIEAMTERLRHSGLSGDSLLEQLRQEMRDDFAAGHSANLYGWMISRTEARVLAAAARLLG